jgi:hypothetical protein
MTVCLLEDEKQLEPFHISGFVVELDNVRRTQHRW